MRATLLLLLLSALAACWGPRHFMPREHVDAAGPRGQLAASYAVPAGEGLSLGEVRVYAGPAVAQYDENDEEVVRLVVGFELENTSGEPFELDPASVRCEELMLDGLLQPTLAPARIEGSPIAMPGTTSRFEAMFLPATTVPGDIDSFSIRFRIQAGERTVLSQVTPFVPRSQNGGGGGGTYYAAWGPVWGVGPRWGWGWGMGWGSGFHCW